jgi:hypothetical protein
MKNTVQALKKSSTVRPGRQAQPKPEDQMTVVFINPDTDFLTDEDEYQGIAAQMKLPVSVFNRIAASAKKLGLSLPEFFNQALLEKFPATAPMREKIQGMEAAK